MLHVIIGPPCAGKSTYVREHAKDGDVRVDFDELAQALGAKPREYSGHPVKAAFQARNAVISYVLENECEAWVIHTKPTPEQLTAYEKAGAEIIELDTDFETCMERAETDGRPQEVVDVIRDYFGKENRMTHFKDAQQSAQVDGGRVIGYASTFDRDPDAYGDVIAKGAFAKSLDAWREKMEGGVYLPLLYGHNTDDPKYNIGRVVDFREDEKGLLVEAEFDPDNDTAQYVRKLAQEGRLYQFSFAFDVKDFGEVTLEDGTKANELRELEIFEVSLVQIPANQHAQVVEVKCACCEKSGRRNSAKDAQQLRDILDECLDAQENLAQIQFIVNGLLEAEAPQPNADEATNADEAKADVSELLDKASKILERK